MVEFDETLDAEVIYDLNERVEKFFNELRMDEPAYRVPVKLMPENIRDIIQKLQSRYDVSSRELQTLKIRVFDMISELPEAADWWNRRDEEEERENSRTRR